MLNCISLKALNKLLKAFNSTTLQTGASNNLCVHTTGEFALFEHFAEALTEFEVALRLSTFNELLQLISAGILLLLLLLLLVRGLSLVGLLWDRLG